MNIVLKIVQQSDFGFLRQMLYEAVFWRSADNKPSLEEGLNYPSVANALEDWGCREGDVAVIAVVNSILVGAAWYRFWTDSNMARGYYDKDVPVVAIAVDRDYRHMGIGGKMIEWLIDYASKHSIPRISLCVSKDNYAIKLYRQQGFVEYDDIGDSFIMVRDILKI